MISPEGLVLLDCWVSTEEEQALVLGIDGSPWRSDLARRVQHYGWRYDYRSRRIDPADYLGPLPGWLARVAGEVQSAGLLDPVDQAIVNEYQPGQGIAPHIDCVPCFGPVVAMLSLLSDIQMDFTHQATGEAVPVLLPRRSLLVISGDARDQWTHAIAKRRTDPLFNLRRQRRISITMRSVHQR